MSRNFREHFENISRTFREHVENKSITFRKHFENISRTSRKHSENISRTFRKHFENISRTFREHFENTSKTFREHFENMSRTHSEIISRTFRNNCAHLDNPYAKQHLCPLYYVSVCTTRIASRANARCTCMQTVHRFLRLGTHMKSEYSETPASSLRRATVSAI